MGLARVAEQIEADGILLLGDNFYEEGVTSVESVRFDASFEEVYKLEDFADIPFNVIAGNHDWLGSVQAQIDYSSKSSRWNFPSEWYSLDYSWAADDGSPRSAQILMIDTVVLAGNNELVCQGCELLGPADTNRSVAQWKWIEKNLQSSTADFLYVAGHYPMYSVGDDGTVGLLVERLLPLLKEHGAHYLCGHDHMAQHIHMEGVHQFQNGMGMECCYGRSNLDSVPNRFIKYYISGKNATGDHVGPAPDNKVFGGFNSISFGDEAATVLYHNHDGDILYSPPAVPRRAPILV